MIVMKNTELRKEFERRLYTDRQGNIMPFRLLMPQPYEKAGKYPLVLFLHGAGERGIDNSRQLGNGVLHFAEEENRARYPCFVVAPQCPVTSSWVGWGDIPTEPMRMALEIVEMLQKEYAVDERRIYVTGISMGGFGAWDALQRKPYLFAAAVPVCGGGDITKARFLADMPVWAFHGSDDPVVSVQNSRDMIEALRRAGGSPRYTEYPGVGHASWEYAYADPELFQWLFSQEKSVAAVSGK